MKAHQLTAGRDALVHVLQDKNVTLDEVDKRCLRCKATFDTSKGFIGMDVAVYSLMGTAHLVEFRRGKGDILEYNKLHTALMERLRRVLFVPEASHTTARSRPADSGSAS